jgi:hypothetical protein
MESGPEFTTTPVITIINTSRLRGRRHAALCCLASSMVMILVRFTRRQQAMVDFKARWSSTLQA